MASNAENVSIWWRHHVSVSHQSPSYLFGLRFFQNVLITHYGMCRSSWNFYSSTTLAKTTFKTSLLSDYFNLNRFIACKYLALWTKSVLKYWINIVVNMWYIYIWNLIIYQFRFRLDALLTIREPSIPSRTSFLPVVPSHMRTVVIVTCINLVYALIMRTII